MPLKGNCWGWDLRARFGVATGIWTVNVECVHEFNVGISIAGCCGRNKDPHPALAPCSSICGVGIQFTKQSSAVLSGEAMRCACDRLVRTALRRAEK